MICGLTTFGVKMAQINNTKKPPQFDGRNYPYWKSKMTTRMKSISKRVWKVVVTKIEIADPENPSAPEEVLLQNSDIALSAILDAIDKRTFEQIKNIEMAHEAWKKLEESGTQAVKGAKAYILKEKFASFKMKEDESVPEMFHRLQVLINDLKALGEEVKDKNFSHKFLRCLPSRFGTLITILVRRPTVERARSTRERLILG